MKLLKPIILLFIFINCLGCKEEVKRQFPPIKVAVNDANEIDIADSIYYILSDTLSNRITVSAEINDANLVYSVNNSEFSVVPNETVSLQKEDSVFQFYLTKNGFKDSEVKTILLQRHSQKFLERVEVPEKIVDSHLNISMDDKSRGIMKVEVINLMGVRMLQRYHFKNSDLMTIKYYWVDFPSGMYIVMVEYGVDIGKYKVFEEFKR